MVELLCGSQPTAPHVLCGASAWTIFNAIELSSTYFSSITIFHVISKQIQQHERIGKIFACWHLAIAITSNLSIPFQASSFQLLKLENSLQ